MLGNILTAVKFKTEFLSCAFYWEETLGQTLLH